MSHYFSGHLSELDSCQDPEEETFCTNIQAQHIYGTAQAQCCTHMHEQLKKWTSLAIASKIAAMSETAAQPFNFFFKNYK